jgi:hypothetical protein
MLAAVGFGALLITDFRVSNQIEKEVQALRKLGVKENLYAEYEAFAEVIGDRAWTMYADRKVPESMVLRMETLAGKKGVVVVPPQDPVVVISAANPVKQPLWIISEWWTTAMQVSIETRNVELFKRLFEAYERLLLQMDGGRTPMPRWPLDRTSVTYLLGKNPPTEVLQYLRAKFEAPESKELLVVRLSRFGREARYGTPEDPQSRRLLRARARTKSWWETAVQSQTLFKKSGDLAVLRSLRVIAEEALHSNSTPTDRSNFREKLLRLLSQDKSGPAEWAAERQITVLVTGEFSSTKNLHLALIHLDLLGSRAAGKPLVPTWSKKYCYDPEMKAPIIVKATPTQLTLSCSSSGGGWSTSSGW